MTTEPKRDFIVVHDYGMGGLWAVIRAVSSDQIKLMYPEFDEVYEKPPDWMPQEEIESLSKHDIDDPPSGLLAILLKYRKT